MTSEGRDALTGLLNRRAFDEVLNQAVSDGRTFALAVFDITGFRYINDTFGMRFADEVLRAVGQRLRSFGSDAAARIGGDEFAVIVDGADPDLGANLSAHLSTAADVPFVVGDSTSTLSAAIGEITVAVGTATAPDEATEAAELLQIADRRLSEVRERVREARTARLWTVLEHQRQHPAPPPKPMTRRNFARMVQTLLATFIGGVPLDEDSRGTLTAASERLTHLSEHGCSAWEEG
jgi:diguanylate cyclase (GGDEF)-like protein